MKRSRLLVVEAVLTALLTLPAIAATGCAELNTTPYQQTASQTGAVPDVPTLSVSSTQTAAMTQDDIVYDQEGNLRPFTKPYTNASETPPTGAGGNYGWWF